MPEVDPEVVEAISIWQKLSSPMCTKLGMWEFAIAMHRQSMTDIEAKKLWAMLEHIEQVTTEHAERKRERDGNKA